MTCGHKRIRLAHNLFIIQTCIAKAWNNGIAAKAAPTSCSILLRCRSAFRRDPSGVSRLKPLLQFLDGSDMLGDGTLFDNLPKLIAKHRARRDHLIPEGNACLVVLPKLFEI